MNLPPRSSLMMLALLAWFSEPALAQLHVDRALSVTAPKPLTLPAPTAATPAPALAPTLPATSNQPAGDARERASGTYVSEAVGANIVAKNAEYASTFTIKSNVPPGSTISNVSWRYALSDQPVGFEAVLCWHEQQPCWNVTNSNSGSTSAFNGKDASQPFTLHYHVRGGGPLGPPVRGQLNQLIVSFDLPPR